MQEIAYGRTLLNTALEAKLSTRAPEWQNFKSGQIRKWKIQTSRENKITGKNNENIVNGN